MTQDTLETQGIALTHVSIAEKLVNTSEVIRLEIPRPIRTLSNLVFETPLADGTTEKVVHLSCGSRLVPALSLEKFSNLTDNDIEVYTYSFEVAKARAVEQSPSVEPKKKPVRKLVLELCAEQRDRMHIGEHERVLVSPSFESKQAIAMFEILRFASQRILKPQEAEEGKLNFYHKFAQSFIFPSEGLTKICKLLRPEVLNRYVPTLSEKDSLTVFKALTEISSEYCQLLNNRLIEPRSSKQLISKQSPPYFTPFLHATIGSQDAWIIDPPRMMIVYDIYTNFLQEMFDKQANRITIGKLRTDVQAFCRYLDTAGRRDLAEELWAKFWTELQEKGFAVRP